MTIEICCESVDLAVLAEKAGASRVELCADLAVGGVTPSHDDIRLAVESLSIPVAVLVRPRGGDFFYSADEVEAMVRDIRFCREVGAEGVVIGALRPVSGGSGSRSAGSGDAGLLGSGDAGLLGSDGSGSGGSGSVSLASDGLVSPWPKEELGVVDMDVMRVLMAEAKGLKVTFHRAIDRAVDILAALDDVVSLGADRVLTSGGQMTAFDGRDIIRQMVLRTSVTSSLSQTGIEIMAGSGVTAENVRQIIEETGVENVHGSRREIINALR